jgi:hypothetical protein
LEFFDEAMCHTLMYHAFLGEMSHAKHEILSKDDDAVDLVSPEKTWPVWIIFCYNPQAVLKRKTFSKLEEYHEGSSEPGFERREYERLFSRIWNTPACSRIYSAGCRVRGDLPGEFLLVCPGFFFRARLKSTGHEVSFRLNSPSAAGGRTHR